MRATVLSVGPAINPKVRFAAVAEECQFELSTNIPTAKQIAHHLYDEVEIVATIQRDEAERVVDGQLQEFHELLSDDPITLWDDWYAANDQGWSDVPDVPL